MARKDEASAGSPDLQSVQDMMKDAARAQERSLAVFQDWFSGLVRSLQEQAESYTSVLKALESSLTAVEKALDSQAQASKALKASLEASQRGMASAASAQERSLEMAKSLFGGMLEMSRLQFDVLRGQLPGGAAFAGPTGAQAEAFQRMAQEWGDAYRRMLDTTMSYFSTAADRSAGSRSES
jgi:DNA repair exonuclease SbcCD ATPase subunit